MSARYLLGPQRPVINFDAPFRQIDDDTPVAVISAGAQEAEGDNRDLAGVVDPPLTDLQLYQRAEQVLLAHPELQQIYRERQDQLQELQRFYRVRLKPLMSAARQLLAAEGDPAILRLEQRHAISQQRTLDRHHLQRISSIHSEFDSRIEHLHLPELADHARDIQDILSRCNTVAIFGGNIAILLNRMRLFGLAQLLKDKSIVACSAGAMVLSERVVLYHDKTPEGSRDAEVFDKGLGLVKGLVLLPSASNRLRLKDQVRLALFSRRFAPARCLTLDSGAQIHYENGEVLSALNVQRLSRNGKLRRVNSL
ncbi:MAG: Type 1 glutamine amidotransferase-like domain-containing protein [Gammaproteobacteria bacterium]|nr:Type 1 glutamine amidotransferase-like domain-containing protein [Gammaproteobacteria bacterium]